MLINNVISALTECTGRRTEVESNSAGRKVKRRKRYKKMVTKMFTNEDGEMGG